MMSNPQLTIPGPTTGNHRAFDTGVTMLLRGALADAALLWTGLLAGIGLWGWALAVPDPHRLIAAGGYTVLVYIPLLWKKG